MRASVLSHPASISAAAHPRNGRCMGRIRAYGEFVSGQCRYRQFQRHEGADGSLTAPARIEPSSRATSSRWAGLNGCVSVGLSTADSYWFGNYTTAAGMGVTPRTLGGVNLFMKNGSLLEGLDNRSRMKVTMEGANTEVDRFPRETNLELTLNNGSIWHNAITPEQKDKDGKAAAAKVNVFKGNQGFIDMTGTNRFLGKQRLLLISGKETSRRKGPWR